VAVELVHQGAVLRRVPLNARRPDIATAFPDVPWAENSGFRATISAPEATQELELRLQAVLEDQRRAPLGMIRGRWSAEGERAEAADGVRRNGGRAAELTTREAKARHQDSMEHNNAAPKRETESSTEEAREAFVEPYGGEHTPPPRRRMLFRIVRERLWVISLMTIVSVAMTTGFSLVVTPEYDASTFVLTIVLALVAGPVLGTGLAFLLEYTGRGRRSPKELREQSDTESTVKQSSKKGSLKH
jgi:hypothetical protein